MQDSIFSLLPPLVAIIIAIWRKNALFALFCGVALCYLMIANGQPVESLTATVLGIAGVFNSLGNIYIISFSLLIGALVTLMNLSGAVNGFINHLASLNLVKPVCYQPLSVPAFLPTLISACLPPVWRAKSYSIITNLAEHA